jgi:multidrug transporter EmrE-like cation transporter
MLWSRVAAVLVGGICVAVADAAIKHAMMAHMSRLKVIGLWTAVVALYATQLAFFAYAFAKRLELGIAGTLQMVAYAATTVLIGIAVFRERLSHLQIIGVSVAVVGCILMTRE